MFSFLCRKLLRYVWRQTMDVFSPFKWHNQLFCCSLNFTSCAHCLSDLEAFFWCLAYRRLHMSLCYFVCVCALFCFISSVLMDVHWWSSVSNFDHQSYSLALFLQDSFHSNRMLLSMPNPQCFTFVLFQYIFRRRLKFTQFVVQNKLANQTFAE